MPTQPPRIYLDHNATTPLHPTVKQAMIDAMDVFGNPSSIHSYGQAAHELLEQARTEVARLINASPDQLVFTSSGSEANNAVLNTFLLKSLVQRKIKNRRNRVITSSIEHPSIAAKIKSLPTYGLEVYEIEVDQAGKVRLDQLRELADDQTLLVSVMMANNEIGTIQDIAQIAEISHDVDALVHTDAVQAVGKIPVDVRALDVDYLSLSAHKIYGPKGVGALYVRQGVPFTPFIQGGGQEHGLRAGTENVIGIVGFAAAVTVRRQEMDDEHHRLLDLKLRLRERLSNLPGVRFNGHESDCLASTLSVSLQGIDGQLLFSELDRQGIAVSTGSACSSGSGGASPVLKALGVAVEPEYGSIRISLGRTTTPHDVDFTAIEIGRIVAERKSARTSDSQSGNTPSCGSGCNCQCTNR